MDNITIKFKQESWKARINNRTKTRMKFTFNLKGEQPEAWKNFVEMFKPEGMSPEDFATLTLFQGIQSLQTQMLAQVQEEAMKDPQLAQALEEAEEKANAELDSNED